MGGGENGGSKAGPVERLAAPVLLGGTVRQGKAGAEVLSRRGQRFWIRLGVVEHTRPPTAGDMATRAPVRKASWVSAWRRSTRSDPTTSSGEAGRAAVQRHCDVGHNIRTPWSACGLPLMTSRWLVRRECRRSCRLTSPAGMCRWSTAQGQPLRLSLRVSSGSCGVGHLLAVVEQGATLGQPSWWSSVMVTSMYSWSPSASFHAALPRTGRFRPSN
jgi:hypothetical protein